MKKPKKMPGPRARARARPAPATGYASGNKLFPTRPVKLKIPLPPGAGPFGEGFDVDPADSEALCRLRQIIDQEIGWASLEDEEAGDYESRLHQVATQLGNVGFVRISFGKEIR